MISKRLIFYAITVVALGAMALPVLASDHGGGQGQGKAVGKQIAAQKKAHDNGPATAPGLIKAAAKVQEKASPNAAAKGRPHNLEANEESEESGVFVAAAFHPTKLEDRCVTAHLAGKSGLGQIRGGGVHLIVLSDGEEPLSEESLELAIEALANFMCDGPADLSDVAGSLSTAVELVDDTEGVQVVFANAYGQWKSQAGDEQGDDDEEEDEDEEEEE